MPLMPRDIIQQAYSMHYLRNNPARVMPASKEPLIVYHYTTPSGFKGIIENKKIWATDAKYLNDSSEGRYGVDLIKEVLLSTIQVYGPSNTGKWFHQDGSPNNDKSLKVKHNLLELLLNEFERDSRHSFYVSCFCSNDNLLSQWRTYGQAGGGFAIGFEMKPSLISNWFPKQGSQALQEQLYNYHIVYDLDTQRGIVEEAIAVGLSIVDKVVYHVPGVEEPGFAYNSLILEILNQIREELSKKCRTFKNSGFASEDEWRICADVYNHVVFHNPESTGKAKFREGRGLLIPYIELPIENEICKITSVRCGPGPEGEFSEKSAKLFLKLNGFQNVDVRTSGIPVRP